MTESEFSTDYNDTITSETDLNLLEFNMTTYFKNLSTYSPKNSYGSCGYVTFIQCLSYYDTFLNDLIIPEKYEKQQSNAMDYNNALSVSPGVLRQSYPQSNIFEFVQNNMEEDYQMYLMYLFNNLENNTSDDYEDSIAMWDYQKLLDILFLDYNMNFSYKSYTDFYNNSKPTDSTVIEWFDNYVKTNLDLGIPVVLHIANYDNTTGDLNNYHSVVAYYYDENGIHANFGWGSNSTDIIITDTYQITEAGIFNFTDMPLSHSNNYTINNLKYCGCGILGHSHSFNFNCYSVDDYKHSLVCECETFYTKNHDKLYFNKKILCNSCEWNNNIDNVTNDSYININTFDYEDYENISLDIFDETISSDSFKILKIDCAMRFDVELIVKSNISFIIFKQNKTNNSIDLQEIYNISFNSNSDFQIDLEKGDYYIGYFGLSNNDYVTIALTRNITLHGEQYLITDPDKFTNVGSQINIIEKNLSLEQKSYRGNTITEGFTRLIYLSTGESRQLYNWHSSNDDIASVTNFGTILAKSVDMNKTVKIMAINKNNPSIIFIKEFYVNNDNNTYISNPINIDMQISIIAGQAVSINLNNEVVPINILQYYSWETNNTSFATIDYWGIIYTYEIAKNNEVIIVGTYKYNERVNMSRMLKVPRESWEMYGELFKKFEN